MTSSWVTAPSPVTTMLRAAMIGVKYSSRPRPTTSDDDHAPTTSTPSDPEPRRGQGFWTPRRLAHARDAWPRGGRARSRWRGPGRRGALRVPAGPAVAAPRTRCGRRRLARLGASGSAGRSSPASLGRRFGRSASVVRSGSVIAPVPGLPGALRLARTCSAARISGPSMVTSPAPIVTTTSPGSAAAATRSATAEKSGDVVHRLADVLGDHRSADAGHRLFPRGVHVEHEDLVGGVERLAELTRESLCARIQVRLEHHHRAAAPALLGDASARAAERGAHLGRMVGVVVEDPHAVRGADQLEAAAHALEPGQPVEHRRRRRRRPRSPPAARRAR